MFRCSNRAGPEGPSVTMSKCCLTSCVTAPDRMRLVRAWTGATSKKCAAVCKSIKREMHVPSLKLKLGIANYWNKAVSPGWSFKE